jgi:hypothetical protein
MLHLLPSAPLPVIEAAYKALSRQSHPDVGGDGNRQRELNAALACLRQQRVAS